MKRGGGLSPLCGPGHPEPAHRPLPGGKAARKRDLSPRLRGEEDSTLLDTLPDTRDEIGAYETRTASQREIQEFGAQLAAFGISFSDVADNCPRQERTLAACRRVLDHARAHPELLDRLVGTGRLPMNELAAGSGTDKKTMERHRKYLVAILLAFTNGYEIIRGHLRQLAPAKGGSGR